ncbi:MAG: hypothetical protein JKX85_00645 [Phycisphaeraceae bacterium]|nr:hypothetical protein [Phycisphaeraceae bacterium]
MSHIGTGIAAGVAQTTYQAGEVNARKNKKTRDKENKTQRISDQFEQHMLAIDEGDADGEQAPAQLRVNEQLPQFSTIHPETDSTEITSSLQQVSPEDQPLAASDSQPPEPEPLELENLESQSVHLVDADEPPRRHLDVQA